MKSASFALFAGILGCACVQPAWAAQDSNTGEKVLHSFGGGADGANPQDGLIDVNGILYGTTGSGGSRGCYNNQGCGTVFALDPGTGAESVLYSFCSQQNCADGQYPQGNLIDVDGTLYGTTQSGGINSECEAGCGTAFALDLKTGAERILHSFGSGTDGINPSTGLIDVKGILYGTTGGGGTGCGAEPGCGTVFAIDPKTGAERLVYSFCSQRNCADGSEPGAALIDVKGILYGTTEAGGANHQTHGGGGTVFAVDPETGAEAVAYSFCAERPNCKDGYFPRAGLIDVKGTLYGTTFWGGGKSDCRPDIGCGMVFALDTGSGAETVPYTFCIRQKCGDGSEPIASLIDVKGTLYGTTLYGGDKPCGQEYRSLRCGTVFAIDPDTRAQSLLYSFCRQPNCTDGELPEAGLIDVKGTLYGTTAFGGATGHGTVFAIKEP